MISGIPSRQRTGIPRRDLPRRFGKWKTKWKTVRDRPRRWSADGARGRISQAVRADADSEVRLVRAPWLGIGLVRVEVFRPDHHGSFHRLRMLLGA